VRSGCITPTPEGSEWLNWRTPPEWILIRSTSLAQDCVWGILGMYLTDFLRYWGHRIGTLPGAYILIDPSCIVRVCGRRNAGCPHVSVASLRVYHVQRCRDWATSHLCNSGHHSFFYKTFPFAHAHHHNQMYINPSTTSMSPLVHLALIMTYLPYVLMWSQVCNHETRHVLGWNAHPVIYQPKYTHHSQSP
jgi:hypothetical protein